MTRNHAAHTVYTTRAERYGVQPFAIGQCPGKHDPVQIAPPSDPFAGIPGARADDRPTCKHYPNGQPAGGCYWCGSYPG